MVISAWRLPPLVPWQSFRLLCVLIHSVPHVRSLFRLELLLRVVLILGIAFRAQSVVSHIDIVPPGWLVLVVCGSLQDVQKRLEGGGRVVLFVAPGQGLWHGLDILRID